MKNHTVCFTGRRKLTEGNITEITKVLEREIVKLIEKGYLYFGTGGALGFDTISAQTILKLKRNYPDIKLILVLPCKNQADFWNKRDKQIYEYIKSNADKIVYISEKYDDKCMKKRNRHLVNHSSVCVCYKNKESGGTAYTVNYARKNNKKIINIFDLIKK